ncbi:MAG: FAD-dependent oxidoreductase, partial [Candidatus Dormibacteraeota bacterium]|nr:FAD-dependent oxidoreductase [Candidatus Dormibacteraeota bacterium]
MRLVAIGGSDAGISAALRARELDPTADVTVIVADAYPNFSICGIPYHVSGDVPDWHDLAHRTAAELVATGMHLLLDTRAERIDADGHEVHVRDRSGAERVVGYDRLVIGTGALPQGPPIDGLDLLGPDEGVHVLHSMVETFDLMRTLSSGAVTAALIIGAGYLGLEMAEALRARGLRVTQVEQLPEVLPTVDPELGELVAVELRSHGVDVITGTTVHRIARSSSGSAHPLVVHGSAADGSAFEHDVDVVLVFAGVRPDVELAAAAGVTLGFRGAIDVNREMRTNLPDVFAAGDCVVTHHRLLGTTYVPLGTTAH